MPADSRLWGHRERLRAKLLTGGRSALADYELLELILSFAIPRKDVKLLAKDLIARFGSFGAVMRAEASELAKIAGMTENSVAAIKTLEAAMVRTLEIEVSERPMLSDYKVIERLLKAELGGKDIEELRVFYMDAKTRLIRNEVASRGTINASVLYPREIAKRALSLGAVGVMIAHNHPSGDSKPSAQDLEMTRKLAGSLKVMDIMLYDHFIVGSDNIYSFKMNGHDF